MKRKSTTKTYHVSIGGKWVRDIDCVSVGGKWPRGVGFPFKLGRAMTSDTGTKRKAVALGLARHLCESPVNSLQSRDSVRITMLTKTEMSLAEMMPKGCYFYNTRPHEWRQIVEVAPALVAKHPDGGLTVEPAVHYLDHTGRLAFCSKDTFSAWAKHCSTVKPA